MHYQVRKLSSDVYQISSFGDYAEPIGVYEVRVTNRSISCNCPGYYRQRDKIEHKHCKIVQYWIELGEEMGVALWFNDNEEIEYNYFLGEDLEYYIDKYAA